MQDINTLTEAIIGAAIEVHRSLGPGLTEIAYERALCLEFGARGIRFTRQVGLPVYYKGTLIARHRPDLLVEERVVVEIKAVERLGRIHQSQMLTYLSITTFEVGLILNFNVPALVDGIMRVVLQRGEKTL
jgi:GxxExxY protein